jgi:hypothetical protein
MTITNVFEAILGREPWRAEMLMRDHVTYLKTAMIRSLPLRRVATDFEILIELGSSRENRGRL